MVEIASNIIHFVFSLGWWGLALFLFSGLPLVFGSTYGFFRNATLDVWFTMVCVMFSLSVVVSAFILFFTGGKVS